MTVPNYALYVAGSDAPEALAAKRAYVAQRRAAGLESMTGFATPKVEPGKHGPTILLTARQVQLMDLLDPSLSTADLAREVGIGAETIRRHIRTIAKALGYKDRAELERAMFAGEFTYRQKR